MNFEVITYIVLPNLVGYLLQTVFSGHPGSDHYYHLKLVTEIKSNSYKFLKNNPVIQNEKNFCYPHLYHWILSFLPLNFLENSTKSIYIGERIIEFICFNSFLLFFSSEINFIPIDYLSANIIFNLFPFSYSTWNAKNSGLSCRGIGLIAGQIYLYLIFAYIFTEFLVLLLFLFLIITAIFKLSQITYQFVLLSIIPISIYFSIYEILLLPVASIFFLYLISSEITLSFLKGQYYHKKNYALYMAKIFIHKARPSIYLDFVYDFWKKLRKDLIKGIYYIYRNPLLEVFYGFIFLWPTIFYVNNFNSNIFQVIMGIIYVGLFCFFITSFKLTRFLGEPQRYMEFTIPFIVIVFIKIFEINSLIYITFLTFSLLMIICAKILTKIEQKSKAKIDRAELLEFLKNRRTDIEEVCVSNDSEILKFLPIYNYRVVRVDYTIPYKNGNDFYSNFNDNLMIFSDKAIRNLIENFKPNLFIYNKSIREDNSPKIESIIKSYRVVRRLTKYEVFELK